MVKEDKVVWHIPQLFSKSCSLILLGGSSMKVSVAGTWENKISKGLEVLCKVIIKAPMYICMKIEPIINDLCTILL